MKTITATAALLLLLESSALAEMVHVVGVHDGDTMTVLTDTNVQIKVRLANIDCPELGQPWGNRAKQALSDLVFNRMVEILPKQKDRYGRTIADVTANGQSVEAVLVHDGVCRVYTQYNHDPSLPAVEQEARQQQRGLWSDPNPVAPWDWRKHKR